MKMLVRTLTIASLFTVAASTLEAQGVAGRWIAEVERTMRNENGNVTAGDKAKLRLVLEQKGDSVTGTLQVVDPPVGPGGRAPTPRPIRGTISGNKVALQTEAEARRNLNGEESVQRVTVVYDLTLDGDKLEGTTIAKLPDMEMPARPFTARRETQPRS
jgi:hypothetical protein